MNEYPLGERLARVEERFGSIHTLLLDIRAENRKDRDDFSKTLKGHIEEDSITFNSIHANLAGIQSQLTSIQQSNNRIESEVTKIRNEEIAPLKADVEVVKTAVRDGKLKGQWWKNFWVVLTSGIGVGGTIVSIIVAIIELI